MQYQKIGVSDRANSRIEYYKVDGEGSFDFDHTVDMRPLQGAGTLPCNIRTYPEQDLRSIIPDLAGPVQILDKENKVISVVNVSGLMNDKVQEGTKHPHDAMFLPNGDFIVAAWLPGRVTYWKKLPAEPVVVKLRCTFHVLGATFIDFASNLAFWCENFFPQAP